MLYNNLLDVVYLTFLKRPGLNSDLPQNFIHTYDCSDVNNVQLVDDLTYQPRQYKSNSEGSRQDIMHMKLSPDQKLLHVFWSGSTSNVITDYTADLVQIMDTTDKTDLGRHMTLIDNLRGIIGDPYGSTHKMDSESHYSLILSKDNQYAWMIRKYKNSPYDFFIRAYENTCAPLGGPEFTTL